MIAGQRSWQGRAGMRSDRVVTGRRTRVGEYVAYNGAAVCRCFPLALAFFALREPKS